MTQCLTLKTTNARATLSYLQDCHQIFARLRLLIITRHRKLVKNARKQSLFSTLQAKVARGVQQIDQVTIQTPEHAKPALKLSLSTTRLLKDARRVESPYLFTTKLQRLVKDVHQKSHFIMQQTSYVWHALLQQHFSTHKQTPARNAHWVLQFS